MARFQVGEVVSEAFRLVFGEFRTYARTVGPVVVFAAFVSVAPALAMANVSEARLAELDAADDLDALARAATGLGPVLVVAFLGAVVDVALSFLAVGVGFVVADAVLRGERPDLRAAWARLSPRFVNLFLTLALVAVAVFGLGAGGVAVVAGADAGGAGPFAFVLGAALVVAVVAILVMWSVAPAASVLESRTVTENLARSRELTKGSRPSVFLAWLAVFLVFGLASVVLLAPLGIAELALSPGVSPAPLDPSLALLQIAVNAAVSFVAVPVQATLAVVIYRKLAAGPAPAADAPVIPAPPA